MDERVLQLKQMKKTCKQLRSKAGRGWKILAWLFFVAFLLLTGATVFVLYNHLPLVHMIDTKLWEPLKAALKLRFDFGHIWTLTEKYGLMASAGTGVLWLIFAVLGLCAAAQVKKTDAYLSWRTLKLTLKTEKQEH